LQARCQACPIAPDKQHPLTFSVGNAIAEREANPITPPGYGAKYILEDDLDKREPQRNTYGKAYTLKMKYDGFKKRDPQNTYGKAYTLKMKDDGFKKRDPQNTYGKAYTLKMEDDGFEKREAESEA
jgi:ubiquinone biosynthesis protein Coq4